MREAVPEGWRYGGPGLRRLRHAAPDKAPVLAPSDASCCTDTTIVATAVVSLTVSLNVFLIYQTFFGG